MIIYYHKSKTNKYIVEIYLFLYAILRFILEFLRGDEIRGVVYNLSTSQIISIFILIFIIFRFMFTKIKEKSYGK